MHKCCGGVREPSHLQCAFDVGDGVGDGEHVVENNLLVLKTVQKLTRGQFCARQVQFVIGYVFERRLSCFAIWKQQARELWFGTVL